MRCCRKTAKYNADPGALEAFMQRYDRPAPAAAVLTAPPRQLPSGQCLRATPIHAAAADVPPAIEPYEPIPLDATDMSDEGIP